MIKALASFGIALALAGFVIYPRPTLFLAVLLFVFVVVLGGAFEDDDEDSTPKK